MKNIESKNIYLDVFIKTFLFCWVLIWLAGMVIGIKMIIMTSFVAWNTHVIAFIIYLCTFGFLSLVIFVSIYFVFRFLAGMIMRANVLVRIVMYIFMTVIVNVFFENLKKSEGALLKESIIISIVTFFVFLILDFVYYKIVKYFKRKKLKI